MFVTKIIRGRLYFSQKSHAFSVPTCTPDLPFTTMIAASAALNASSTSPTKSKYPGVSKKFTFISSYSIGTTDVPIENLRLISSLSKSLIVFPSSTLARRFVTPVTYAIASIIVVFPALPCPSTTTLRICFVSYIFFFSSFYFHPLLLRDFFSPLSRMPFLLSSLFFQHFHVPVLPRYEFVFFHKYSCCLPPMQII